MDQTVSFVGRTVPTWPSVAGRLAQAGLAVQLRMIDGQLAFPDELPPEDWSELRVGTPQGMVTVRRQGEALVFVTWGNADAAMRQAWNALAWAFAEVGGGLVDTPRGPATASDFARQADLPPGLQVVGPGG